MADEKAEALEDQDKAAPPTLWQRLKKAAGPFWAFRGVASGLACLGLLAELTELSQFEIARAIIAVILSWNWLAEAIAGIISQFLPVFDLGSFEINVMVISISICITVGNIDFKSSKRQFLRGLVIVLLLNMSFHSAIMFGAIVGRVSPDKAEVLSLYCFTFTICMMTIACCFVSRAFKTGVFYLISFLIAVQLAYFLPIIGPHIKAYSDAVLTE